MHPTVIILPLTLELHDAPLFRVTVRGGARTGLLRDSQIMVDKVTTVPRARIGTRVGKVDAPTLQAVDQALRGFLGL
jgi:mRNA interferase MazF